MSTLVGPLPGVYPAMTSKTGRLMTISAAKRLTKVATYIRKSFTASFLLAVVRLFAGVGANMNSQCTPLDEALPTALGHT